LKTLLKTSSSQRIALLVGVIFVALAVLFWKPLSIAYHRYMMVTLWQSEFSGSPRNLVGLSRPRGSGPSVAAKRNHEAGIRAITHRDALVNLGYFIKKRFPIRPVAVGTAQERNLIQMISGASGQQPLVRLDFDQPIKPNVVLGLTVYATPGDLPRWEQFITTLNNDPE
jgi:hypothetical protein